MKLRECLEMGKRLGLTTVREAYLNVDYHAMNMFTYSEIVEEMNELNCEYNGQYNKGLIKASMTIDEALKNIES